MLAIIESPEYDQKLSEATYTALWLAGKTEPSPSWAQQDSEAVAARYAKALEENLVQYLFLDKATTALGYTTTQAFEKAYLNEEVPEVEPRRVVSGARTETARGIPDDTFAIRYRVL